MITPQDLEDELARRDLLDFTQQTHHDFVSGWFHRVLCDELMQFYQDVQDGKQPHLMVFAPPRHGKTEITSRRFPAWLFGKDPDLQIIACSYSFDLAARNNRDVQRVIETENYRRIFPETSLNTKNIATLSGTPLRNNDIFEIVGHRGSYRGAGVGGGITGMGFDIGIIDDPIKNADEANSQTVRDGVYEWYTTTFATRRSPRSGVIIIMTRWHVDDLCGRLLKEQEGKWRVLTFPAIAEADEKHRKAGEPLDPARYSLDAITDIKASMSSRNFSALYQQAPKAAEGEIIKQHWLRFYNGVIPDEESVVAVRLGCDPSIGAKVQSDYTGTAVVIVTKLKDANSYRFYIADVHQEHLSLDGRIKKLETLHQKWGLTNARIEGIAGFKDFVAEVRRRTNLPVTEIDNVKDKITTLESKSFWFENGKVFINENIDGKMKKELIEQLTNNHPTHDDMRDAVLLCIDEQTNVCGFDAG